MQFDVIGPPRLKLSEPKPDPKAGQLSARELAMRADLAIWKLSEALKPDPVAMHYQYRSAPGGIESRGLPSGHTPGMQYGQSNHLGRILSVR